MKADEPAPRLTKYGMTAEHQHCIVERHFAVTLERKFFDDLRHRHAVQQLPKLAALIRGEAAVLTVETPPAMPAPPPPSPLAPVVAPVVQDDLRARLGLI